MTNFILKCYRFLFGRKIFYKLNKILFNCSLKGLGVLNYESNELSGEKRFLSDYLQRKNNCIVFDVGANIGGYSRMIFEINPTATVYAFEPHPKTFQNLIKNIKNQKFYAYNYAIGHKSAGGRITLYDYEDSNGSSHASVFKEVIETIHKKKSVEHKVEVITLDSFIKSNSITGIDLLKIDTEGNELDVIKGMSECLSEGKIKIIQFEFNEMNVISRTFFKDFWDILPNYEFYRMLPDGLVKINRYEPVFCEIFAYQNIVAILKDEKNNLI